MGVFKTSFLFYLLNIFANKQDNKYRALIGINTI